MASWQDDGRNDTRCSAAKKGHYAEHVEPNRHIGCCRQEGYNVGVSAVMRYFFDQDLNLAILSNMAKGAWEPSWKIHELIVGGA